MKRLSLIAVVIGLAWMAASPLAAQTSFAQPFRAPAPAAPAATADPNNPFANWAGFFIAGDYRASTGAPSEVFDNGRRDMAKAFEQLGISPDRIAQFSVRPNLYPGVQGSLPDPISAAMVNLGRSAAGCVFFFTSHGSPDGVVMGEYFVPPEDLAALIDGTCGAKPTVAIVSACYSGVFVPVLKGANRMVMTAARPDRSSFGCGESNTYTFFDQCILESLPRVGTFDALAASTKACVETLESSMKTEFFRQCVVYALPTVETMEALAEVDLAPCTAELQEANPPSEPQVSIGPDFNLLLPLLKIGPGKVAPPATASAAAAGPPKL